MILLYNMIIERIETNKSNYNIDYKETIETIRELLEEIQNEYESIELLKERKKEGEK